MADEPLAQIYVVLTQDRRFARIGWTRLLHKRLLALNEDARTWSALLLGAEADELLVLATFPGPRSLEPFLHEKWTRFAIRGGWFTADRELLTWAVTTTIEAIMAEFVESELDKRTIAQSMRSERYQDSISTEKFVCGSCWGENEHRKWCRKLSQR